MQEQPPASEPEKLPSCPPKVYDASDRFGRQSTDDCHRKSAGNVSINSADLESSSDAAAMPPAAKAPWWSRYSGYQKLRTRPSRRCRAIISAAIILPIALIAVLVALYKTGHLGHHPAVKIPTQIVLTQGTYKGEISAQSSRLPRAVEAYRGVPYAQSTGGDNRFRAPQPLPSSMKSSSVYSATEFGDICPQSGGGSEDCLNLNLYRPHFGDNATADALDMAKLGGIGTPLPVIIYVHGGGFGAGAGKERNMASFVSWAETPIIGINFNYRVGAFGFLPSSLTKTEGVLNLGLKDQQMLFSWVQKNVAAFGGDPDNVTIMGLSAGAHSVGHQLISYAPANKLTTDPAPFHKVILESGAATARAVFAPSHPLHEEQFTAYLAACGLSGTADNDVFTKLRVLPFSTALSASIAIYKKYYPSLRWAFQPVIDGPGGVIPDLPLQSWKKGNFMRIPILTGFDTNEGALFVPTGETNSSALRTLMGGLVPALNESSLETMEAIYPDPSTTLGKEMYIDDRVSSFGTEFWRLDDGYAHYAYICPVLQTAHYATTSTSAPPLYVYHFSALSQAHGATDHGDEAPVVVHDMAILSNFPGLIEAADAMTGYWSRFAVFGDPNPSANLTVADSTYGTTWQQFESPFVDSNADGTKSASQGLLTLFGEGNDERMIGHNDPGTPSQTVGLMGRELEECEFWFNRTIYSEGFGNGSLTFA